MGDYLPGCLRGNRILADGVPSTVEQNTDPSRSYQIVIRGQRNRESQNVVNREFKEPICFPRREINGELELQWEVDQIQPE